MRTGLIESWGGNPADTGPMYPFAGSEVLLFVICFIVWVVYTVWQMRCEFLNYEKEKGHLGRDNNLIKTIENNQKIL